METTRRIKILCVDDHPLVRDGIAFALQMQSDMVLVGEASDGIDAVTAFRKFRPDVTLMDLQMPNMSGVEATMKIREEFPHAKIIVLTTYSGDIQASRALKAGAVGYILKNLLRSDLIDTIRRVYAGQRRIPAEIAQQIAENISSDELSSRETEVLRHVAAGCSNKVVGDNLGLSEDTCRRGFFRVDEAGSRYVAKRRSG